MRVFIAVDIPDTTRRGMAGLGGILPNARAVPEDQLHLTLRFLGEVEGGRLLDIQGVLAEISRPPFPLRLKGVGTFPPRGIPRVLYAGVDSPAPLFTLRQVIDRKLADLGIPRDKQKFIPHLTLARLKNCPLERLRQFLAGNALLVSPDFPVEGFTLYGSRLTRDGAIHTPLHTYPLTAAAASGER
jgi:2'-5' RNA ligase